MSINVNYQKFNACIENLTKLDKKIYENLNNYVSFGRSLQKSSVWSGVVSENYVKDIILFQQDIEEIHTQFLNIISSMRSNYNYYKNTDQIFNETFSNIFTNISKVR